jgi:hypothetical protein
MLTVAGCARRLRLDVGAEEPGGVHPSAFVHFSACMSGFGPGVDGVLRDLCCMR